MCLMFANPRTFYAMVKLCFTGILNANGEHADIYHSIMSIYCMLKRSLYAQMDDVLHDFAIEVRDIGMQFSSSSFGPIFCNGIILAIENSNVKTMLFRL